MESGFNLLVCKWEFKIVSGTTHNIMSMIRASMAKIMITAKMKNNTD
jgi:hypothetical protein